MADYDLIVLGTGSAGTKIAQRCREEGWRVAITEEREFGGTCALRGCEPKKTLWVVAEAADRARRLGNDAGLSGAPQIGVDWPALMNFKRSFTDPVPEARRKTFADAGIEALCGSARFVGPDAIVMDGQTMSARHIVIATGAKPAPLPIPGIEHLTTSDEFLDLDELPNRLLLLGGGYISFEFAHIAARAGSEVTVLHKGKMPLEGFDADLTERLVEHSRRCGIRVELEEEVKRIERREDGQIAVHTGSGKRFEAPVAVHGLGRIPNIDNLDLAAGEVETEEGKLKLDRHLRSMSNERVFAAGDAASVGPPLTPVSTHDADCVSKNLIEGCRHAPNYEGVASVVFTIPPFAKVGITEAQARENGRAVDVHFGDMSDYQSVRRQGHAQSGTAFKVILDPDDGCILGAHLYAPDAHEAINLFALSVRLKLSEHELGELLSAYPSEASNIGNMLG